MKYSVELDRDIKLSVVHAELLLGSNISADALNVFEALAFTSNCYDGNKLYKIFNDHPRRLEALVKSDVVNIPFDLKKVYYAVRRLLYCNNDECVFEGHNLDKHDCGIGLADGYER